MPIIDEIGGNLVKLKGLFSHIRISDDDGTVTELGGNHADSIFGSLSVLGSIYGEPYFDQEDAQLIGTKMYPEESTSFRQFLREHPAAPTEMKNKLIAEAKLMRQADMERKSMTVHKVTSWDIELSEDLRSWLLLTPLPGKIPRVRDGLVTLRSEVLDRVTNRHGLDLLS